MTADQGGELERRSKELHSTLEDLRNGKVLEDDPVALEGAIQREIDEIEFEVGSG